MSRGPRQSGLWRAWAKRLPDPLQAALRHLRSGGIFDPNARLSFSQEGEDLMISRLFDGQPPGFYIDVGAHHPTRYSNTHLLYKRGWWGINIDPTPGSMVAFNKRRRRDINLEIAISSEPGTRRLHLFDDPALNSLSTTISDDRDTNSAYSRLAVIDVQAMRLADVLSANVPAGVTRLDLMNVDVEGHDFDVLRSNDWSLYRPRVLVVEILRASVDTLATRPEMAYMKQHGYALYAKTPNSVLLIDTSWMR